MDNYAFKICTRCGEAKPKEAFYWRISKATGKPESNGGRCKPCRYKDTCAWRNENREQYNGNARQYRAADPERHRTYMREYSRKWREEHREEYNANQRRSYARRKAAATTNIKKELDDGRTLDNA